LRGPQRWIDHQRHPLAQRLRGCQGSGIIGFEARQRDLDVLESCASSPNHFLDVDVLEIKDAFVSIASSIRKLRLTQ